jgi:hypothetical protein
MKCDVRVAFNCTTFIHIFATNTSTDSNVENWNINTDRRMDRQGDSVSPPIFP